MGNATYSDLTGRFDPDGPHSDGKRRGGYDRDNALSPQDAMTPETVGDQFARKGWTRNEVPVANQPTPLKPMPAPGGNALGGNIAATHPAGQSGA